MGCCFAPLERFKLDSENDNSENENEAEDVARAELVSEAELVEPVDGQADPQSAADPQRVVYSPAPIGAAAYSQMGSMIDMPVALENIKAKGGAVGAVVLGLFAVVGSFLTGWSAINAAIGLCMGLWGLTSPKRTLALIGVALCVVGALLCIVDVSEFWGSANSSQGSDFQ